MAVGAASWQVRPQYFLTRTEPVAGIPLRF
eukprot:COSAG01_NODE_13938_length_1507_cov_1.336627_4_plen_29_part_01